MQISLKSKNIYANHQNKHHHFCDASSLYIEHGVIFSNNIENTDFCNFLIFVENPNVPKFERERYDVSIVGKVRDLPQLYAEDPDIDACAEMTTYSCPCGLVTYSINSGNELGLFTIDKTSGELFYEENNHVIQDMDLGHDVDLVVEAKNKYPRGEEFSSTAIVHVTFQKSTNSLYSSPSSKGSMNDVIDVLPPPLLNSHSRRKRALNTGIPDNTTMQLDKVWTESDTSVKVGDKIGFKTRIWVRYT